MRACSMKQVMIILGLSGAGRTTALRALEDAGFHTMDNPPLSLLPDVVAASLESQVAIGLMWNSDRPSWLFGKLACRPG